MLSYHQKQKIKHRYKLYTNICPHYDHKFCTEFPVVSVTVSFLLYENVFKVLI